MLNETYFSTERNFGCNNLKIMQYDDYFKSYVGVSKETVEQLKKKIKLDTVDIKKNVFDVFDVSIFK